VTETRDALTALVEQIKALRRKHIVCDDRWYSCPLSVEGCGDDSQSGCTCGAEAHNQRVDAVLAELAASVNWKRA
jgi:hypothetical protein